VISLILGLGLFGTAVLYSAANGSMSPWATPHLIQLAVFLAMALMIRLVRLDILRLIAIPAYVGCLLLLILVEVIGQVGGGSQRWLDVGPITIQPSELMKIALILLFARYYEQLPPAQTATRMGLVVPAAAMVVPAVLILIQPDLDAALVLVVAGAAIMFLGGVPLRVFGIGAVGAAVLAPLAYFFVLEPYQQTRLIGFLDPESDPLGTGYHVIQSKIAIGSGGFFGKGFLNGSQAHLDYLPEHHTDLIFATMFEEWGLVGGAAVLLAFWFLLRWARGVAARSQSRFGRLAASGMQVALFLYVAMNMLTATGLAPVMGIPLPLMSHGGSAMMTVLMAIGILMAIECSDVRGRRSASGLVPA
jgi:rod shape determining protein RodA